MGGCASYEQRRADKYMAKTLVFVRYAFAGDVTNMLRTMKKEKLNPNVQDRFGMTALHWAAYGGKLICIQELLKASASTTIVDQNGRNALHHACRKDHDGVVRFLLTEANMDINSLSESKDTPLHKAVTGKSIKCIEVLLQLGADANLRNDQNRTPLEELDAEPSVVKDEVPEPIPTARMDEELARWRLQFLTEVKGESGPVHSSGSATPKHRFVNQPSRKYSSPRLSGNVVDNTLVTSFRNQLSELSDRMSSATDLSSRPSSAQANGVWATPAPHDASSQSESVSIDVTGHGNDLSAGANTVPLNVQSLADGELATDNRTASQRSIPSLRSTGGDENQEQNRQVSTRKNLKYAGKRIIMMLRVKKYMTGADKRQFIRLLLEKHMKATANGSSCSTDISRGNGDHKPFVRAISGVMLSMPPNS